MALYIDSAFLDHITMVAQTVPVAGVTTNPSIMLAAQEQGQVLDDATLFREIARIIGPDSRGNYKTGKPVTVFIQPGSTDEKEMLEQALTHASFYPNTWRFIVHKLPMTPAGLRVANELRSRGLGSIAFTAVTTTAQAYVAAMAGAEFVIPYYNRLKRAGVDADQRIAEIAQVFYRRGLATRILAASIKSPQEAVNALYAGAHDITAAPQVLLEMVSDPQTDEAIGRFAQDWKKMKKV
jgi:TalC/MipB family fructose-6-phosphate aldolase